MFTPEIAKRGNVLLTTHQTETTPFSYSFAPAPTSLAVLTFFLAFCLCLLFFLASLPPPPRVLPSLPSSLFLFFFLRIDKGLGCLGPRGPFLFLDFIGNAATSSLRGKFNSASRPVFTTALAAALSCCCFCCRRLRSSFLGANFFCSVVCWYSLDALEGGSTTETPMFK